MSAKPPAAASRPATNQPKRRWRRRLLYISIGLVLLVCTLYLFRVPLFSGTIKQYLCNTLASQLQAEVQIKDLDGSWLSDVHISELHIVSKNSQQALQELHLADASLNYSLWGLLNGASIGDISSITAQGLRLKLQSHAPAAAKKDADAEAITPQNLLRQLEHIIPEFNPQTLANAIDGILPQIQIDGQIDWQRGSLSANSQFALNGNNQALTLTLSASKVAEKAYSFAPIRIERLDPQTFQLNAEEIGNHIAINNARCTITPQSLDLRLPLTLAQQEQNISWHYTQRDQEIACNFDFYWQKTPPLLRSFFPHFLPQQGHSRLVATVHRLPDNTDLSCMLDLDDLCWELNKQQDIKASAHLFIKNTAQHCSIEMSNLHLRSKDQQLSIKDSLHIKSDDLQTWTIDKTQINTSAGTLHFGGVLSPLKNDLRVAWNKVNIEALCKAFAIDHISGFCDGSLTFSGSLEDPLINFALTTPALSVYQRQMHVEIACSQNADGISIDRFRATQAAYADANISGFWPGRMTSNGWQTTSGKAPSANIHIEVQNLHNWPELQQTVSHGDVTFDANISNASGEAVLQGSIDTKGLSFVAIESNQSFAMNGSQTFYLDSSVWKTSGTFTQSAQHYVSNNVSSTPPGPLQQVLADTNNWDDVLQKMRGSIVLQDMNLKLIGSLPRIGDLTGEISIHGRRIETKRLSATLGYEPVLLSGFIDMGYPRLQEANIHVQGHHILVVQSPDFRLRTDCNLHVVKTQTTPLFITGDVNIVEALYSAEFITANRHTPEVDKQFQLFSLPESFLGAAHLDLNASANNSIIIHNSMMHANASAELKIRGTGMVPEPSGDILIHEDGGRLSLPFATIWFKPSTITFKASAPFDPSFAINGETKMQGYNLRILLEGRMSDFSVNGIDIVSNPPISPEDATRLITTGIPPRDAFGSSNSVDTSGLVIGWAIVETMRKLFGNGDPRREKLLDRIEVQIGRSVSENGLNTIEVTMPISHGFFIKAERDKYEDYNTDLGIKKEW